MEKTLRCAIYTRKSSEEGLEQGFNSLHAQREACEAYVLSQAGEGWKPIKTLYDDGGFSGGSMDRPGLKSLLGDIAKGLIDIVVVYKVDRLTRSLADFAKIVEAFDRQGVSFVSVTQAFNTTTSMGRLTLNVLLSFAQFEREVTGERIRDKVAASKAKGMWMGGTYPLGYDPPPNKLNRALQVNPAEAEIVRSIFAKYLELGSAHEVLRWIRQEDIRSKRWVTAKGRVMGGYRFDRGALFYLLKNPTYIGMIPHKELVHPGLHDGIVDPAVFEAVQKSLSSQAVRHRTRKTRVSTMILRGKLFDDQGDPMSPSFTHGADRKVYRYYVSSPLLLGSRKDPSDDGIRRVSADVIEGLVKGCLTRLGGSQEGDFEAQLQRAEVHPTSLQLLVRRSAFFKRASDGESEMHILSARLLPGERLTSDPSDLSLARVILPCRLKFNGGKIWITHEGGRPASLQCDPDPVLIRGLQAAHAHIARCGDIPFGRLEGLSLQKAPTSPYERKLSRLAFLSPDIQTMILEGRQPTGITVNTLLKGYIPPSWEDQRRMFGIPC
jgi:DNA invertase Pin-like site-specific DNA recombinase